MKKKFLKFFVIVLSLCILGCATEVENVRTLPAGTGVEEATTAEPETTTVEETTTPEETTPPAPKVLSPEEVAKKAVKPNLKKIPAYSGVPYIELNNNIPYFTEEEMSADSYEYYSALDELGRCGVCVASIGKDIMPTEERGQIGSVKPTGWHTVKYPGIIPANYLYNRCHLIAYQLAGENANVNNLITGTRYMNMDGIEPFEDKVADYVNRTGNHVMYRVMPVFEGNNLVANGVVIEAKSVEDNGKGIQFNVYCYNVQPGIEINYATGASKEDGTIVVEPETTQPETTTPQETTTQEVITRETTTEAPTTGGHKNYAVNGKNGKIHMVGACNATGNGKNAMTNPIYFDTYEEAEARSVRIDPKLEKRKCGNCWK